MQLTDIENSKRLAIFAYYDAEGIVDDYVVFLLQAMRAQCTAQIVVVNGTLVPESEARVKAQCTQLLYRPNEGFDITAYKEAFLQTENPEQYDEIIFYNQTVFGPVCSLHTMFNAMAQKNLDFWGLTRHKGARKASWDTNVSIAPHVQSYFFAVRRSMFAAPAFREYWENLPVIGGYWDAVSKHEVLFTQRFAQLGYAWGAYLHTEDLEAYNDYPMMGMPLALLHRGSPFIKRKSFLCSHHSYTTVPQGAAPQQAYDYVRTCTDYPVALINQNLLRTADAATLHRALTLSFDPTHIQGKGGRTAAVLWFAGDALGEVLCAAAGNIQKDTAILCLFASNALRDTFKGKLPPKTQCIVTQENGMAYLFGKLWKNLSVFENILYLNSGMPLLLDEFYDATTLQTAVDSLMAAGCGALLEQRADIGALVPPASLHQECLSLGLNWPILAPALADALHRAGIDVPLGASASGFAVRGGMFFARTRAVEPLSRFPFEASHFEGLYPACEYLVPLAAQSTGFLTASACTRKQAVTAVENSTALLREMTAKWATPRMVRSDQVLFRMQGILDFYYERRYHMTLEQAFSAKLTLKQKIWICLQIFFAPKTFARLQKLLGHKDSAPAQPPRDELE
ncbi:MAG: rhamnan synthesis F family protein [Ruthenibacterium sp.]